MHGVSIVGAGNTGEHLVNLLCVFIPRRVDRLDILRHAGEHVKEPRRPFLLQGVVHHIIPLLGLGLGLTVR